MLQAIQALLKDDRRLATEREAFQKQSSNNKYQGYTRDQMQYQGGGASAGTSPGWGEPGESGWRRQSGGGGAEGGGLGMPEASFRDGEPQRA